MQRIILNFAFVLCGLFTSAASWALGTVDSITGDVSLLSLDGYPVAVVKGDELEAPLTITTADNSEILIKTNDNGWLLLKPNSKLIVQVYQYKTGRSQFIARLLKGEMAGATGVIGKESADAYRIRTESARLRLKNAQYHVALDDSEKGAPTYLQLDKGEANVSTRGISLNVNEQQWALATGSAAPELLASKPNALFNKALLNADMQKLNEKNASSAIVKKAKKADSRVPQNCAQDNPAQKVLDDFIKAYERGDTAYIQRRLDPSMVGYGAFVSSMMKDVNVQKQTRFLIQNRNVQCGSDLAVINFRWEKRFLDLTSFTPRLQTGQAAVLTHLKNGEWKLSGVSGDNPFAPRLNRAATLIASPNTITLNAAPTIPTPFSNQLKLVNADIEGTGVVQVEALTSTGDRELFNLTEVQPGIFVKTDFTAIGTPAVNNDGLISIALSATTTITFRYLSPGNGLIATATLRVIEP